MTEKDDVAARTAEIIAEAEPADYDTEDKLVRMRRIKTVLIPQLEEEYAALREELVASMPKARHFVDADGTKRYAFVVRPEKLETDVEVLRQLLPPAVFESITEPVVRAPKLKAAVKAGRVSPEVLTRAGRLKPQTPHVRFADPTGKDADA